MKDMDFDDLLDGVLREDGRVEPLSGLEERVLARLRRESQRSGWRGAMWALVAAGALAVGVMGWMVVRPTLSVPSAGQASVMQGGGLPPSVPDGTGLAAEDREARLSGKVAQSVGAPRRVKVDGSKVAAVLPHVDAMRNGPIDIRPLEIEPIEILSQ